MLLTPAVKALLEREVVVRPRRPRRLRALVLLPAVLILSSSLGAVLGGRGDGPPPGSIVRVTLGRATAEAWFKEPPGHLLVVPTRRGAELHGIEPGSALARVGFVNGDTVTRVDGGPDGPRIVVGLIRAGRPVTLVIHLV